jgi:hypothetical protein
MNKAQWKREVDVWVGEHGGEVLSEDEVVRRCNGYGKSYSHRWDVPGTYVARWTATGRTTNEFYREVEYLYEAWFSAFYPSPGTYKTLRTMVTEEVVDVGGTIFSADILLKSERVKHVFITNFMPSPQSDFYAQTAEKYGLPVTVTDEVFGNGNIDFVAVEYLAAFKYPFEEVARLLNLQPHALYVCNSFCIPSYGHHLPVIINDVECFTPVKANLELRKAVRRTCSMVRIPGYNSRIYRIEVNT